jgi:hypothetical protein
VHKSAEILECGGSPLLFVQGQAARQAPERWQADKKLRRAPALHQRWLFQITDSLQLLFAQASIMYQAFFVKRFLTGSLHLILPSDEYYPDTGGINHVL